MTNHMAGVAKLLGVELRKAFRIVSDDNDRYSQGYFRLTEEGIEDSYDSHHWNGASASILERLMTGETRVAALPWKPQVKEEYYIPRISLNVNNMYEAKLYVDCDDFETEEYYTRGLICKTKEEAIEMTQRMMEVAEEVRNDG